jgi:hypothetical protein
MYFAAGEASLKSNWKYSSQDLHSRGIEYFVPVIPLEPAIPERKVAGCSRQGDVVMKFARLYINLFPQIAT